MPQQAKQPATSAHEVSNDFGFDLLKTERDLFHIDHCAAGAYLAQDWDFPDELAAAIAVHHDDPVLGQTGLDGLVRVSWRLADTLGLAAFSSAREWGCEELMAYLPAASTVSPRTRWLGRPAAPSESRSDGAEAVVKRLA